MRLRFGGIFDYDGKVKQLAIIEQALEDPALWSDKERAQTLGRDRMRLSETIHMLDKLSADLQEALELFQLCLDEADEWGLEASVKDIEKLGDYVYDLEFQRMFSGEMDPNNAYVDIHSGSGGTEAQDWAEMLLRMYLRWGERRGFATELIEMSPGDVAGIKSATVKFTGPYAYGWLRTETGVHRLVRKSPFDSGNRRHTSFASVFVSPEVDESIEIDINPADLRVDTYRASGAGGQHVNRTDSAVRITHVPTNTVVQCQSNRSQHQNRANAMAQLRAKLYTQELEKRNEKQAVLEASKTEIGWGNQIRSYVLDQSRIKDLRTGVEVGNTVAVLDGNIDQFIEASLKSGMQNG